MKEWATVIDHVSPTSFIFHISRCGSTLLSQLLGLNEESISLSEVPIFDDILRLRYKLPGITEEYTGELLQAAMKFYGQKRFGTEKNMFIKTDSWHIHFYRELRTLYPDVPFLLLYRAPAEVFESHVKLRGTQTVPGLIEPEVFGFANDGIPDFHSFPAKVIASYLTAYITVASTDSLSVLLNYNEGMTAIMDKIARVTNIKYDTALRQKMEERTGYHSKYPGTVFSEQRDMPPPECLWDALDLYNQVELLRFNQTHCT
ncbi:hypothetical protein BEL04_07210 [Mucilaginibacter sp. PPCGB 2223]|nr:hypothetical protein BEL04_07210 [Mucilaginibacter sp. PPCGB 2223]